MMRPTADHPGFDPGDGRPQCPTCGKWVWLVTHSCKGVRIYPPAESEVTTTPLTPGQKSTTDPTAPGNPLTSVPLEGVVVGEPRCTQHGTGYTYHGFSTGAPPAHVWEGATSPKGCLRCHQPFEAGDRYLCDEGGVVHVTCPTEMHWVNDREYEI